MKCPLDEMVLDETSWSGNFFLVAPFPDHCLLVLFGPWDLNSCFTFAADFQLCCLAYLICESLILIHHGVYNSLFVRDDLLTS